MSERVCRPICMCGPLQYRSGFRMVPLPCKPAVMVFCRVLSDSHQLSATVIDKEADRTRSLGYV